MNLDLRALRLSLRATLGRWWVIAFDGASEERLSSIVATEDRQSLRWAA